MTESEVDNLVAKLASTEGTQRQSARETLISEGGEQVVAALLMQLRHPDKQVRWEAAKCLHSIASPNSADALVSAMDDESEDVRWVASEGVAALRETGLFALLKGICIRARSISFCKAAHHTLRQLDKQNVHREAIAPVIEALHDYEPEVASPVAAYDALGRLTFAQCKSV